MLYWWANDVWSAISGMLRFLNVGNVAYCCHTHSAKKLVFLDGHHITFDEYYLRIDCPISKGRVRFYTKGSWSLYHGFHMHIYGSWSLTKDYLIIKRLNVNWSPRQGSHLHLPASKTGDSALVYEALKWSAWKDLYLQGVFYPWKPKTIYIILSIQNGIPTRSCAEVFGLGNRGSFCLSYGNEKRKTKIF